MRLESGVYQGMEITPYYDSLIAKLIVWGETRAEAILRMRRALAEYRIMGVKTTIPFHIQVMNSTRYQAGQFEHPLPGGLTSRWTSRCRPTAPEVAAIAATLLAHAAHAEGSAAAPGQAVAPGRCRRADSACATCRDWPEGVADEVHHHHRRPGVRD